MKIVFITTGGTIDKTYSKSKGTYNFEIGESSIQTILKNVKPNFEYEVKSILKKDSLDLDENDRQLIFDTCNKIENDKIVITHGTEPMIKTAEKLSSLKNKTVVLVGSAQPEKFKDTDADFNMGCAVGAINTLNQGVYITMNGRVFKWNECKKLDSGHFTKK